MRRYIAQNGDAHKEISAFICTNDRLAAELIVGLRRVGVNVPRDCSVVGFDDDFIASSLLPELTTLRQPRRRLAERATEMLLKLMEGKTVDNEIMKVDLIERGSTCFFKK